MFPLNEIPVIIGSYLYELSFASLLPCKSVCYVYRLDALQCTTLDSYPHEKQELYETL